MKLWVHVIWLKTNPGVTLQTMGPKEDRKFESFIYRFQNGDGFDETRAALAWYLYVNSTPRAYNLRPVRHVDKFTTKNGNVIARAVKDTSALTRFPLSAFLAVCDGYYVQASMQVDAFVKAAATRKQDTSKSITWLVREELGIGDGLRTVPSDDEDEGIHDGSLEGDEADDIVEGIKAAYRATQAKTASLNSAWGVTQKDLEWDAE